MWKTILGIHNDEDYAKIIEIVYTIGALYKIKDGNFNTIQGYPFIDIRDAREHSFSYMPLFVPKEMAEIYEIPTLLTFEDMLENICKILVETGKVEYDQVLSTDGLTEITEDEFYKID